MFDIVLFQVWFQNRRAKWKKRKKATNVFRTPGALLPSTGLSPFSMGSMGDAFCAFPPSAPDPSRWPAMTQIAQQMNHHHNNMGHLTLSSSSLQGRQNLSQSLAAQGMAGMTSLATGGGNSGMAAAFGNGLGGLNMSSLTNSINMNGGGGHGHGHGHGSPPGTYSTASYHNTMTASCSSPMGGSSPSPTLPVSGPGSGLQCGLSDMDEAWRGSSIAALRRKAMEHSVNLSGYR
ncbi:hypothetical protein V1264_001998 [Littorina saxatilis]|uniref:Uncharacterized protein n=1 Tax=Littorina saxatilis TaxID=31220 RepID=A0AAN9C2P8_9CAEN